jgi:predicted ATPase
MSTSALEKIAAREQILQATADQLTATIAELTVQLEEATAELGELATARRVLLRIGEDEPRPPNLPDNPIYQEILALFTDTAGPIQARAVCERLGLSTEKNSVEGMRSKLNRLVSRGLLLGDDAGRFELARH